MLQFFITLGSGNKGIGRVVTNGVVQPFMLLLVFLRDGAWVPQTQEDLGGSQHHSNEIGHGNKHVKQDQSIGKPQNSTCRIGNHCGHMNRGARFRFPDRGNGGQWRAIEKDQIHIDRNAHQEFLVVLTQHVLAKGQKGNDHQPKSHNHHGQRFIAHVVGTDDPTLKRRRRRFHDTVLWGRIFGVLLLLVLVLELQLHGCHVEPDTQQESRSIGKKDKQILSQDRIGHPTKAISQHKGPRCGVQISQHTNVFGLVPNIPNRCKKHDIGSNNASNRTNILQENSSDRSRRSHGAGGAPDPENGGWFRFVMARSSNESSSSGGPLRLGVLPLVNFS
mmetsp:Transcript_30464/g.63613  ORF Transcript_30464/g.63613 Transcript_30464/m.63613 type:complete len:333 (-) Transcript_30464:164-1162(-)